MLFVCSKEPEYIQILSRYCYFLIKIPLAVGSSPSSQGNSYNLQVMTYFISNVILLF